MTKAVPKKVSPEFEELADNIGTFIEYWGFKRIHGKIWAHLFLSPEPLDAGELRTRLKVSKALISMSLSDLLKYDVVRELGKGPKNTLVYSANPDYARVIANVLRARERRILSRVQASFKAIPSDTALDSKRLKILGEMIQNASKILDAIILGGELETGLKFLD
jgi:DNA-binding transcriptional regulator GbsR (MarR family)